jgi:hypothetical protein
VFSDVMLRGFFSMSGGMDAVSGREVSVMPGGLVIARLVMFGGVFVVFRSLLVMLGRFLVVFCAFVLSHLNDLLDQVVIAVVRDDRYLRQCRRSSGEIDDVAIAVA